MDQWEQSPVSTTPGTRGGPAVVTSHNGRNVVVNVEISQTNKLAKISMNNTHNAYAPYIHPYN